MREYKIPLSVIQKVGILQMFVFESWWLGRYEYFSTSSTNNCLHAVRYVALFLPQFHNSFKDQGYTNKNDSAFIDVACSWIMLFTYIDSYQQRQILRSWQSLFLSFDLIQQRHIKHKIWTECPFFHTPSALPMTYPWISPFGDSAVTKYSGHVAK